MEQITFTIEGDRIRLDQLLKAADILPTGGAVRFLLEEQAIRRNGELVTEKRKQLFPGDIVTIQDVAEITIVAAAD